ncbi:MAG: HupE/UreJ family protein [Xanthobacteraceae bacterium]
MPRPLIPVKAGIRRRLWDWVSDSAGTSAKLRCVFALIVVVAIAVGGAAQAHQVNLSTARVELRPDRTVAVEIALKGSDADRLAGTQIYDAQKDFADPAKVAASAASIAGYVSAHTDVTGTDGKACARGTAQVVPDGDGVIVRNVFSCRNVAGDLVYRSTVLTASDRSARQVVLIGAGENAPQALLDDAHTTLTISAPAPSLWSTMQRYLVTGIEHIFLGYDHIAFLVAIVLWARRLLPVIKVVTAFTIAHSITLSLAALQIVVIPSAIVEPAIAASIIFVAVENFFSRNVDGRWRVTFAFGLIHGFGFAGALQELGLPANAVVPALAAFNIGVEIGQVAIVSIVVPALIVLDRLFAADRTKPVRAAALVYTLSAVITVLGSYWLVTRVFES